MDKAHAFLDMMDAFERHGSEETKRIRQLLLGAVDDFQKDLAAEDPKARDKFEARVVGVEIGVYELLIEHVKKIQKEVTKGAKQVPSNHPMAKRLRDGAGALGALVDGLKMFVSAKGDAEQKKARALIAQAKEQLEVFRQ